MFKRKTVFIVGAGASSEAGLPVGTELANSISRLLLYKFSHGYGRDEGDQSFLQILRRLVSNEELNAHLDVARSISDGVQQHRSIDNYVDANDHEPKVSTLAKAAIAYCMLKKERSSRLFIDPQRGQNAKLNFDHLKDTWYPEFGIMVASGCKSSNLTQLFENVSVICFNYDRCIEQFLCYHLSAAFGLPLPQAQEHTNRLEILRPYGSLGTLFSKTSGNIDFGAPPESLMFQSFMESIKTYTEQIEDRTIIERIKQRMSEAETIVFLGFGFHQVNMKLLQCKISSAKHVIASAQGLSRQNADIVGTELRLMLDATSQPSAASISVDIAMSCGRLLKDYSRVIMA